MRGQFVAPRSGDPRVARIDDAPGTQKGGDGLYYRMEEERDWSKYHVVTDADIREERQRSLEIKENMLTLRGSFKNNSYHSRKELSNRFSAPIFGTGNRRRKNVQSDDRQSNDITDHDARRGDKESKLNVLTTTRFHTATHDKSHDQDANIRSDTAAALLQKKYEENLKVIEQLHQEKQQMQSELEKLHAHTEESFGLEQNILQGPKAALDPDDITGSNTLAKGLSARELADVFDADEGRSGEFKLGRNITRSGRHSLDDAALSFRGKNRSPWNRTVRSSSASRVSRSRGRVTGISSHLQADADRYIQKRRLYDEGERLRKVEQEQYEQFQRRRLLNASKHGGEFLAMRSRHEAQHEASQAKLDRIKSEREYQLEREKQDLKSKLQANKANMVLVTKNQLSWRDRQEIEEAKRRDRIERRKQELVMNSSLPAGLAENLSRKSGRRGSSVTRGENQEQQGAKFRAEDPEKVAAKLARQTCAWNMKFKREMNQARETHAAKMLSSTVKARKSSGDGAEDLISDDLKDLSKFLLPLERRELLYAAKRDARNKRKELREAECKQKKLAIQEERRQQLMKARIPETKETNTSKLRAAKARYDRRQSAAVERSTRRKMEEREKCAKEHAAVLKTIMYERDQDLRQKVGGYKELRSIERNAADTASRAREEYRSNLRALKQRMKDSLQNRPSLIERHDEWVARKRAANIALHTVAGAVIAAEGGEPGKDQVDSDDDNLFDAKEQILLGLR